MFAFATKQIGHGRMLSEKKTEAMVQRLGWLTQDEARITTAQILEILQSCPEYGW